MEYEEMRYLPSINGCTVIGDKQLEDYGLVPMTSEDITELILEEFGYLL